MKKYLNTNIVMPTTMPTTILWRRQHIPYTRKQSYEGIPTSGKAIWQHIYIYIHIRTKHIYTNSKGVCAQRQDFHEIHKITRAHGLTRLWLLTVDTNRSKSFVSITGVYQQLLFQANGYGTWKRMWIIKFTFTLHIFLEIQASPLPFRIFYM